MKQQPPYTPAPADLAGVTLPDELLDLSEQIARNVHETWAARRIAEGWTYGAERDDSARRHPCLVPYDQLPGSEKDYDRATALATLKLIRQLGFTILPPH